MSTFTGLNTMVTGIFANQTGLNTVGHNIVNAGTTGYSRQMTNDTSNRAEYHYGYKIGTGVSTTSITRSRDIYADKQYWDTNSTMKYYDDKATHYDRLEAIFNDSKDEGIHDALGAFYQSWVDLSTEASSSANRNTVIEKGKILCNSIQTAATELQDHIESTYENISLYTSEIDDILQKIVNVNKLVVAAEADGSSANDLRDQRDLLVDNLSDYINVTVNEDTFGNYQINCNGVTLVDGPTRLHLKMSAPVPSSVYGVDYGVSDYTIQIKESNIIFMPTDGKLRAEFDTISKCKEYIDDLANMSIFMMTSLNDMQAAGYDMNGREGRNFFGVTDYNYGYSVDSDTGIHYLEVGDTSLRSYKLTGTGIIEALEVNPQFSEVGGYKYIAAATAYDTKYDYTSDTDLSSRKIDWGNRTADGTNAVYISELFNMPFDTIVSTGRVNATIVQKYTDANGNYITATGQSSLNSYYQSSMTKLGVEASSIDTKYNQYEGLMTQIQNWRDSASGVDWNDELTKMIMYQKGYSSCARCLTAIDECLDKLVNGTGTVGR